MINRNIEEISKEDLKALVENEVIEHKTIEYKRELPGNSDGDKKEFLADVTSFANASGGDLVYGIVEDKKTGKPKSLDGLSIGNPDQELLRLDGIIRTGVQPRIPSVICSKPIPIQDDKFALVIRVQKSWIAPHRVILGGHDKFYSRSSNGKYPLDVGELRMAFTLSESISERIRNFRTNRLSQIIANDTPVTFYGDHKIVLHLIPVISFDPAQSYDLGRIMPNINKLKPISSSGWNERYNLDGFLSFTWNKDQGSYSYTQLYRNGIIEAVEGLLLEPDGGKLLIPSIAYEQELIKSTSNYLSLLRSWSVAPPVFIFLSLLGVKGFTMGLNSWRYRHHDIHAIDRDTIILPEVVVDNYDLKGEILLKPSFDSIWNACGFQRDFYYNEQGEWKPG